MVHPKPDQLTRSYAYVVWFTCERVWAQDNNFNPTMRVILEQAQCSYSHSLLRDLPGPTSSFDHLQYEVNDGFIYPDPILHNCLGTIAYHCHPLGDCQYRNTGGKLYKQVSKNWRLGEAVGCPEIKANNT